MKTYSLGRFGFVRYENPTGYEAWSRHLYAAWGRNRFSGRRYRVVSVGSRVWF